MPSEGELVDQVIRQLGGCRRCGVIPLQGAFVCEHGVWPAAADERSIAVLLTPPPQVRFEDDDGEG